MAEEVASSSAPKGRESQSHLEKGSSQAGERAEGFTHTHTQRQRRRRRLRRNLSITRNENADLRRLVDHVKVRGWSWPLPVSRLP